MTDFDLHCRKSAPESGRSERLLSLSSKMLRGQ
jgi:hypothetical protein